MPGKGRPFTGSGNPKGRPPKTPDQRAAEEFLSDVVRQLAMKGD